MKPVFPALLCLSLTCPPFLCAPAQAQVSAFSEEGTAALPISSAPGALPALSFSLTALYYSDYAQSPYFGSGSFSFSGTGTVSPVVTPGTGDPNSFDYYQTTTADFTNSTALFTSTFYVGTNPHNVTEHFKLTGDVAYTAYSYPARIGSGLDSDFYTLSGTLTDAVSGNAIPFTFSQLVSAGGNNSVLRARADASLSSSPSPLPVPEAPTGAGLGLLVGLGAMGMFGSSLRRRRVGASSMCTTLRPAYTGARKPGR